MIRIATLVTLMLFGVGLVLPQSDAPRSHSIAEAQTEFQRALAQKGQKAAFLEFLSDDSVVFQPDAMNGKEYWNSVKTEPDGKLTREMFYLDMSSNGMVGYSTGRWEWKPKGKDRPAERGHFVTVWAKRQGGRFRAVIDLTTTEDEAPTKRDKDRIPTEIEGDPNKRGWSAADPSMNFLKAAMSGSRLGGAYSIYAADEIRLIREGDPPIVDRKRVMSETENYRSITYPKRVVLNESADMAYVWNPCEYADSDEGVERGNCLHIWKLRDKKWNITLGVLSRVRNMKKPELRLKPKQSAKQ